MAVRCRARGALLLATLATATSSSGRAAASPATLGRCDADPAATTLGVSRHDWHVACLRLDTTRRVIAAVPLTPLAGRAPIKPGSAPPLVLRLGLAKGDELVWHSETRLGAGAPADLREVLEKSEEWLVDIDGQTLGAATGLRIGVMGHWGGEMMSVREVALIFRLPADTGELKLLWSGLGNTRESRSEYCLIEGMATFHLVDDRTIERQMRVTAIVNRDTPVPPRRARTLEKGCVVKPQPAQRFTVSS